MPDITVQVANAPVNVNVSHVGLQGAIGPSGANGTIITNYVSGISVTGFGGQTGLINITGAGSVVVLTGLNNTIIFSGAADTGNSSTIAQFNALSGNVYITGQTLNNRINLLSGYVDNTFALLSSPRIFIGSGSPEGSVQAVSGSLYTDWYNQTFYMKISGNSSNAYGWV